MIVDIFIRTYSGDIRWLNYCLKSIHKFSTGFRNIIVCIPHDQVKLLSHLTAEKVVTCPLYVDDYIGQQITKLKAYEYTDAEYIMYIDSDCIFTAPFSPEDYIRDERPIIVKENYERLKDNKDAYARKAKMREHMGFDVEFEYMRRHPFVYATEDIHAVGSQIEELPLNPAGRIITRPLQGMSEFNVLGAYCERNVEKQYVILEVGIDKIPDGKVKQFRSWDGITEDIEKEIEACLN
jgi:hypothetical protein